MHVFWRYLTFFHIQQLPRCVFFWFCGWMEISRIPRHLSLHPRSRQGRTVRNRSQPFRFWEPDVWWRVVFRQAQQMKQALRKVGSWGFPKEFTKSVGFGVLADFFHLGWYFLCLWFYLTLESDFRKSGGRDSARGVGICMELMRLDKKRFVHQWIKSTDVLEVGLPRCIYLCIDTSFCRGLHHCTRPEVSCTSKMTWNQRKRLSLLQVRQWWRYSSDGYRTTSRIRSVWWAQTFCEIHQWHELAWNLCLFPVFALTVSMFWCSVNSCGCFLQQRTKDEAEKHVNMPQLIVVLVEPVLPKAAILARKIFLRRTQLSLPSDLLAIASSGAVAWALDFR